MPALLRDDVLRVSYLLTISALAALWLGMVACIGDNATGPFPEHRWDTKPAKGPTIQLERATTVGQRYHGDPRSIILDEDILISLQIGSPLVPPPRFILPANP